MDSATVLVLLEMACTVSLLVTSKALVLAWALLDAALSCEVQEVYHGRLSERLLDKFFGLGLRLHLASSCVSLSLAKETGLRFG
jgi:hypothetical protein